ncbi:MAG: ABC transporter permease [Chloroflexota bacterium]|nr:ABC transporter permease [Chloroflexota bacterium]
MARFLAFRLLRTLLTLLGVVALTFVLGRLTGDPVALMLPQQATLDDYNRMRAALGLDQPLLVQFVRYLEGLTRGDLGRSIVFQRPAAEVVAERIPATLALGAPALLLSVMLGVPLGMWAAYQRNRLPDRLIAGLSLAGQSLPSFAIAIVLILVFSVTLRWTPTFGSDTWRHYILPTITLTLYPLAIIIRLTRSSMLEVLNQGYMRTAAAKGLSDRIRATNHALPNALIPVVTVIGLQVAAIISGAAIVEAVFAWPGLGTLAVGSIGGRDYPVIQTIVLISAAAFGIGNLLVDLAYFAIDPRIQTKAGG